LAVAGPIVETILDVVEAEEADMIVIGSRGKTDLEGLLLGSITHQVLHVATVPVLVVR
jgi:nucleotide-binding universal stress UspA family protein